MSSSLVVVVATFSSVSGGASGIQYGFDFLRLEVKHEITFVVDCRYLNKADLTLTRTNVMTSETTGHSRRWSSDGKYRVGME